MRRMRARTSGTAVDVSPFVPFGDPLSRFRDQKGPLTVRFHTLRRCRLFMIAPAWRRKEYHAIHGTSFPRVTGTTRPRFVSPSEIPQAFLPGSPQQNAAAHDT